MDQQPGNWPRVSPLASKIHAILVVRYGLWGNAG
jgi:hypothetical protein